MMRRVLFTAICAASLLSQSPAFAGDAAATLSEIRGSVLVGTDRGFREVSATTRLRVGDRVAVAADSGAVLSYGRDCSVALPANSEVTITEQSCVVGTQNGPFSFFGVFRPLTWGILPAVVTFIATAL